MQLKFLDFLNKDLSLNNPQKNSESVSGTVNPAGFLLDIFNGRRTVSGEFSSHENAMMLDSYFAGIRNISEDISKLPFDIFEKVENGKKLVNDHFAQILLDEYANENMASFDLFQTIIQWAISYGNGFAEIVRNGRGEAVDMWPIHPSRIKPFRDRREKLWWDVFGTVSNITGEQPLNVRFSDENIFNLRGLGANGIIGYSVFALAADSIGQGIAVQKFASAYFGNATNLSGALVAPSKLSKEQYTNLRESWNARHAGGSDKKHQVAILEAGLKFEKMSSTASEAQLLEAQKFTVERMARLLRIPPHKLGHNSGLVKANFEAESIAYFRDTLTPWIKRISLETNRKIIKDRRFTGSHSVNALSLGDSKTLTGVIKTLRNTGQMSINEGRRLTNDNVIEEPWANEHHMQSNITTVQNISEGANMRPKTPAQNGAPPGDDGQKAAQAVHDALAEVTGKLDKMASDSLAAIEDEIEPDLLTMLTVAKSKHLPTFRYAAQRIVKKELNFLTRKLKSSKDDLDEFMKLSEIFFANEKAEIIDVFSPCCEVFIDTFGMEGINLDMEFLSEFADNYAKDGIQESSRLWNLQKEGEVIGQNLDDLAEKLASDVITTMANNAKGLENETE